MRRLAWLVAAALLIVSTTVSAQSHWSAEGAGMTVWVGAGISTFNPDYGCKSDSPFTCGSHQLLGVSPFVDANHVLFRRLGFEAQARILPWRGPGDGLSESSYMAGPKVSIARFRSSRIQWQVPRRRGTHHIASARAREWPVFRDGSGIYSQHESIQASLRAGGVRISALAQFPRRGRPDAERVQFRL